MAYAIANYLQDLHEPVALLSLFDAIPAVSAGLGNSLDRTESAPGKKDIVGAIFGNDLNDESLSFEELYHRVRQDGRLPEPFTEGHFAAFIDNYSRAHHRARSFLPRRYQGDLVVFVATIGRAADRTVDAWRPYVTGNIRAYPVASTHADMMNPGPLAQIGPLLAEELRSAP